MDTAVQNFCTSEMLRYRWLRYDIWIFNFDTFISHLARSYHNVIMCESVAPHVKWINSLFYRTEGSTCRQRKSVVSNLPKATRTGDLRIITYMNDPNVHSPIHSATTPHSLFTISTHTYTNDREKKLGKKSLHFQDVYSSRWYKSIQRHLRMINPGLWNQHQANAIRSHLDDFFSKIVLYCTLYKLVLYCTN